MSGVFEEEPRVPHLDALEDHRVNTCHEPAIINLFPRVTRFDHSTNLDTAHRFTSWLTDPFTNDASRRSILHYYRKSRPSRARKLITKNPSFRVHRSVKKGLERRHLEIRWRELRVSQNPIRARDKMRYNNVFKQLRRNKTE